MKNIRLITLLIFALFTTTIIDAQKINTTVSPDYLKLQPNEENAKVKAAIAEILKNKVEIYDKKNQLSDTPEDVLVLDDRIEFKIKHQNTIIYFSDFIDDTIEGHNSKGKYILELKNFNFVVSGYIPDYSGKLQELRRHLIFIQNQLKKIRDTNQFTSQLILFEPIAAQYRVLSIKPPVSEEQRKYIVQANSFNQLKQYDQAIELYNKAIELNQTSYPEAYFNIALLSAQINKFNAAIFNMKKYLLLAPEAEDARAAQDKIYEWELNIEK